MRGKGGQADKEKKQVKDGTVTEMASLSRSHRMSSREPARTTVSQSRQERKKNRKEKDVTASFYPSPASPWSVCP